MKSIKNILKLSLLLVIFNSCSYQRIFDSPTITQLSAEDYLAKIAATENSIVIDVRTSSEYEKGHLSNAINISYLNDFKRETAKLDTNKTVFLYCQTAHRSPFATKILKKHGFTEIYDLEKGYSKISI